MIPAKAPASVVLFRALLLTSIFTGFIGGFIDAIVPNVIPDSLVKAYDALPNRGDGVRFGVSLLILTTFGGTVASMIGLYTFQPWSRKLAVVMTLLGLLFYPLLGVSIQSGWAQLLLDVSSMLWGAVIAMSYVSSLSARFGASNPLQ